MSVEQRGLMRVGFFCCTICQYFYCIKTHGNDLGDNWGHVPHVVRHSPRCTCIAFDATRNNYFAVFLKKVVKREEWIERKNLRRMSSDDLVEASATLLHITLSSSMWPNRQRGKPAISLQAIFTLHSHTWDAEALKLA